MKMVLCSSLFFLLLAQCTGFSVNPSSITTSLAGKGGNAELLSSRNGFTLFMSTEVDSVTSNRRRRRKKVATDIAEDVNEDIQQVENAKEANGGNVIADASIDLKPGARAPVSLEVRDVRGLVGGVPSAKSTPATPTTTKLANSPTSTTSDQTLEVSTYRRVPDDSFAQLLEDARRMSDDIGDIGNNDESIKVKARNILSTIVTADFFVVCVFLLWFLAGIGFRAIFNDDSVQIAFNNNFELLVQPALGVLMMGTIAGNFLKDEEEED